MIHAKYNTMRIHVLHKITFFLGNKSIDTFHYTMFHGLETRPGCSESYKTYFLDDIIEHPLHLTLDFYRINPIIQPGVNLLVIEPVKKIITQFENISFLPVTLSKVKVIPYREGDFSHWDNPDYQDDGEGPDRLLLAGRDERKRIPFLPQYTEVIGANSERVKKRFKAMNNFNVEFKASKKNIDIFASPELVKTYPLQWQNGVFIVHDSLFQAIQEFINPTYFEICSLEC